MEYIRITEKYYAAAAETEAACLDTAWTAAQIAEAAAKPIYAYIVAVEGDALCGVCSCIFSADEGEILNLAVKAEYRRQGVGKALLEAVRAEAAALGCKSLMLEVASRNEAARRLYESAGFASMGIRKNFYPRQKDDAVIMALIF